MTTVRLGIVRFLNTLPLVDGLECLQGIELVPEVPSRLVDALRERRVDVALCSSIDAAGDDDFVALPAGLLGSEADTLTVRLFSRVEIDAIRRVHCDTDSHTSVALLRILLAERYAIRPPFVPHEHGGHELADAEAVLLIGDKVITEAPARDDFPYRIDLGAEWRSLTGLPFVLRVWLAHRKTAPEVLERALVVLDRQRRANALRIDSIVHTHAPAFGWPRDVARDYLRDHICYGTTPERFRGLERFLEMAIRHGVAVPGCRPGPVSIWTPDVGKDAMTEAGSSVVTSGIGD